MYLLSTSNITIGATAYGKSIWLLNCVFAMSSGGYEPLISGDQRELQGLANRLNIPVHANWFAPWSAILDKRDRTVRFIEYLDEILYKRAYNETLEIWQRTDEKRGPDIFYCDDYCTDVPWPPRLIETVQLLRPIIVLTIMGNRDIRNLKLSNFDVSAVPQDTENNYLTNLFPHSIVLHRSYVDQTIGRRTKKKNFDEERREYNEQVKALVKKYGKVSK